MQYNIVPSQFQVLLLVWPCLPLLNTSCQILSLCIHQTVKIVGNLRVSPDFTMLLASHGSLNGAPIFAPFLPLALGSKVHALYRGHNNISNWHMMQENRLQSRLLINHDALG